MARNQKSESATRSVTTNLRWCRTRAHTHAHTEHDNKAIRCVLHRRLESSSSLEEHEVKIDASHSTLTIARNPDFGASPIAASPAGTRCASLHWHTVLSGAASERLSTDATEARLQEIAHSERIRRLLCRTRSCFVGFNCCCSLDRKEVNRTSLNKFKPPVRGSVTLMVLATPTAQRTQDAYLRRCCHFTTNCFVVLR